MEIKNKTETPEETKKDPKTNVPLQNIEGNEDNMNLDYGDEGDDPELNHNQDDDLSLNIENDTAVNE